MVETAFGLQYKHDDHTTANQFIDEQLEKINSQALFALEQDRLKMIRVLLATRVALWQQRMERIWIWKYFLISLGYF